MESSDETCPICLNEMKGKVRITTACSHTFCFDCIATNTGINDNCPLCRQNVDIPAFKDCIVRDRIDTLEELEFENDVEDIIETNIIYHFNIQKCLLILDIKRCLGENFMSYNIDNKMILLNQVKIWIKRGFKLFESIKDLLENIGLPIKENTGVKSKESILTAVRGYPVQSWINRMRNHIVSVIDRNIPSCSNMVQLPIESLNSPIMTMIRDCVYSRFEIILDTTRHLLERDIMLNYRLYEEDTDDYGVAGGGIVGGGTRDAASVDGSDVENLEDNVIDDLIRDLDEDRIINDNIWRLNINNILENRDFIINNSYSIINNIPIENVD
jgi:hypothetical protein